MHKTQTVQMDIHQCHAAAGLMSPHCKQKFGEMEGSPTVEMDSNTSTNNSFPTHLSFVHLLYQLQSHVFIQKITWSLIVTLKGSQKVKIRSLAEDALENLHCHVIKFDMGKGHVIESLLADVWVQKDRQDEYILISLGPSCLKAS